MADTIPRPLNPECLKWYAHLSWYSGFSIVVISVLLALAILDFQGVYHDASPGAQSQRLLTSSAADPDPTFFIVRDGDDLTLIRNRTPIAYFLTGLFGGVILLFMAGLYQTFTCLHASSQGKVRGVGFMHFLLPGFIAAFASLMFLGAFPLVAVGERIDLKPAQDALIINGERFAALHEITSFGSQMGITGSKGGRRQMFVANLGHGRYVVLDALLIGHDVLDSHPGAPSDADYLTDYMREMHKKYPEKLGRGPWPAYP